MNHSDILKTIERLADDIAAVGYSSQLHTVLTLLLDSKPDSHGGLLVQWFNGEIDPVKKRHLKDVVGIIARLRLKQDGAIENATKLPGYCKLIRRGDVKPKGRQQPEHEVTKWVRKHWHKYGYVKKSAVLAYIELHGGTIAQLYEIDLKNDLKKNPLLKPSSKRKKE